MRNVEDCHPRCRAAPAKALRGQGADLQRAGMNVVAVLTRCKMGEEVDQACLLSILVNHKRRQSG